jgi:hypothetical protein
VHDVAGRLATSSLGRRDALVSAVYGLCLLQLVRVIYTPASLVPTAQDVAAGEQLVARLAAIPGRVFVPFHGYLPHLAGKQTFAHAVMISDVIRGGATDVERGLARELNDALRAHAFNAVVAIEPRTPVHEWLPIAGHYQPAEAVVTRTSRFWRPERHYVPR